MSYLVKGYMDKDVPTIAYTATVTEAAKMMSKANRGFLIILREGQPVGIVTENDFVQKVIARELNPNELMIGQIMASPLITVDPDEDLLKASQLMREHRIRRLPVMRNGILYGIITSKEIALRCGEYVERTVKDIVRWTAPLGP